MSAPDNVALGDQPQSLLLRGGRCIDPANQLDQVADVLLTKGRITAVEESISPSDGVPVIDVSNCWVMPGLIDMHVHLREPGEEYKEDVISGTRAAAAGGFTAVACMPNTQPVNDSAAITAMILARAAAGSARVYPVGAVSQGSSGSALANYGEMHQAGIVAVSDDGRPVTNSQLFRRALEYASDYHLPVISHSEDPDLSAKGAMNEGPLATRLGLRGIPNAAEAIMVYRDLALAQYTGRPVHIAHVSTMEALDLIRQFKVRGCPVTAETAPHYFSLTEEAVRRYDSNAKMNPPLRTERDRQAVCDALADGTLDAIATDHAPHSMLEKDVEFDLAANGIIGLETAVPLTLALVREKVLTPDRMVELMSVNPARILGVEGGSLGPGRAADITVVDPHREFRYRREEVVSKSCNSPFLEWDLTGRAVLTIVGGRITADLLSPVTVHQGY